MLFQGIIIFLFLVFVASNILWLISYKRKSNKRQEENAELIKNLNKDESFLKAQVEVLEANMTENFFFYDLIRSIDPIINKKDLFNTFFDELSNLGEVRRLDPAIAVKGEDLFEFVLGEDDDDILLLRTKSERIVAHLPYFMKLLSLCVERISLYDKLHQLSIYDSLTQLYNRRYFMMRYQEEFNRAKKFKLSLAYLTIDIDHFKKVNDTYGHLVGDVVLKEVARIVKENIREIDFAARYGGEEFAIILPETDKAGAIMVAERISTRVAHERISAFDEIVSATISIGVASFPKNTLHSDVLMEISDKALYKAKISGRNRVCWF